MKQTPNVKQQPNLREEPRKQYPQYQISQRDSERVETLGGAPVRASGAQSAQHRIIKAGLARTH